MALKIISQANNTGFAITQYAPVIGKQFSGIVSLCNLASIAYDVGVLIDSAVVEIFRLQPVGVKGSSLKINIVLGASQYVLISSISEAAANYVLAIYGDEFTT